MRDYTAANYQLKNVSFARTECHVFAVEVERTGHVPCDQRMPLSMKMRICDWKREEK